MVPRAIGTPEGDPWECNGAIVKTPRGTWRLAAPSATLTSNWSKMDQSPLQQREGSQRGLKASMIHDAGNVIQAR